MNKIEALRREADMRALVEGTGLCWEQCVKHNGNIGKPKLGYHFADPAECYEFALAVVEGKPVFDGDILYIPNGGKFTAGAKAFVRLKAYLPKLSWNPPKPKTVTIKLTQEEAEELCEYISKLGWGNLDSQYRKFRNACYCPKISNS